MIALMEPIGREVLAKELHAGLRVCAFRGLEVLLFRAEEAPHAMQEVGRIREEAFRQVGAGRNVASDLDRRDFGPQSYCQLVVWDPDDREIVAAYRYLCCGDHDVQSDCSHLRTSDLFAYTDGFRQEVLPFVIELGRSVVNKRARRAALGLYGAWMGLGALLCEYADMDGFFGTFSVYKTLPSNVVDGLLAYLQRYHAPTKHLLSAREERAYHARQRIDFPDNQAYRTEAYAALQALCREEDTRLPPILLSYLGAAPAMQYLGVARDPDFGDALECAILITREMLDAKVRSRFLDGYRSVNPERFVQLRHRGIPL